MSLDLRVYNKNLWYFFLSGYSTSSGLCLWSFVIFCGIFSRKHKGSYEACSNSPGSPVNIPQHNQPASLCLDLKWEVCGNSLRSQEDPKKGTIESQYCWVLGLMLESDFIDVCLFKSTFPFPTGSTPRSSWLFTCCSFDHREWEVTGLLDSLFSRSNGNKNKYHSHSDFNHQSTF